MSEEAVSVTLPEYHKLLTGTRTALGLDGRGAMSLDRLRDHAVNDPRFPKPVNLARCEKGTRLYRLSELRQWMANGSERAA